MGGISMSEQSHVLNKGLHIVIATPGRLIDMLEKKRFTFNNCKFLCMDEADRMIDLGFEDDVRNIMSFFKVRSQSLSFSFNQNLSFPSASKADFVVLGHHAQKDSRLCKRVTHQTSIG
jgi:superfamily II DNA/RNA helicase